ncbi:MAG: VWA domain-containing protein [Bacteroidales bacterium]|nr:VWA domain-containing protein [Bacteroidales bacterium]
MFDFAYPHLLFLLFSIVAIGLLFWWAQASRKANLRKFGHLGVLEHLMPDASKYKPRVKIVLQLLALAAIIIVLCRPRAGEKVPQQSRIEGIEIMIAFDVSNSMLASANDDPNGISRLDRARLLLEKLLTKLDNDKVGLVVFAGEAKTQMPLTTDYYTAKMYLSELSPKLVSLQGTAITDAINMSANSFSKDDKVNKAIILITDAENHEGDAIEAAKSAADKGIQIDVIGVGSAKGVPIPINASGTDYLRDKDGQVVLTSFDEEAAKRLAEVGDGIYVNGASSKALDTLVSALDEVDKTEFKKVQYKASAEQFPTFAWIALGLLIIDLLVVDRKMSWLKDVNLFSKKKD